MKKISILTSTPPGSAGVGDIFLSNIINNCDVDFRSRISLVRGSTRNDPFWNNTRSHVIRTRSSGFPVLRELFLFLFIRLRLERVAARIAQLLASEGVGQLWVTLSSPEVILVAERLSRVHAVEIFATIWDLPEYFLGTPGVCSSRVRHQILWAYRDILMASVRVSCISEGMADHVSKEGVPPERIRVIRNGVFDGASEVVKGFGHDSQRIVFVGSLYAKEEWNALVAALESVDFIVDGVVVELIHVGRFPRFGAKRSSRVKHLGVLPHSEVLHLITVNDIGYLPYWMDSDKALIVNTSFPGKLSTYVVMGAKTLFHGPDNSSVSRFFETYPVGLICSSRDHIDIIDSISTAMTLHVDHEVMNGARYALSVEKMARDFMDFIQ